MQQSVTCCCEVAPWKSSCRDTWRPNASPAPAPPPVALSLPDAADSPSASSAPDAADPTFSS